MNDLSERLASVLLGAAIALVAFGDLRNLVSALGYWLLWGLWFLGAQLFLHKTSPAGNKRNLPICLMFFFILIIGALLGSGITNQEYSNFYQAAKMLVIGLLGVTMTSIARYCSLKKCAFVCLITMLCAVSIFFVAKYFLPGFYIVLGDSRAGTLVFYPGVMWKVGALLLPVLVAGYVRKDIHLRHLVVGIAASALLIGLDGSRTALLYFMFVLVFSVFILFKNSVGSRLVGASLGAVFVLMLVACLLVVFDWHFSVLALSRLSEGDPTRKQMMLDGYLHAIECLPFGCGFGTSTSFTGAENMVVHNAYLAVLGEIGIFGLIGFLGVFVFVIGVAFLKKNSLSLLAVLGVIFLFALHPFSTEMSEWGWYWLACSWLYISYSSGVQGGSCIEGVRE